jgi:hypothetical protein
LFDGVDRRHELIYQIRSLAMLRPNTIVMSREEAIALLEELETVTDRLAKLKAELHQLADQA